MKRKPRRKCKYVKAIPKLVFENEKGGIEIRRNSIKITGVMESAALALANTILNRKVDKKYDTWNYMNVVDVVCVEGKYNLNLTGTGLTAIDLEQWNVFKKSVETICNNLTAFM